MRIIDGLIPMRSARMDPRYCCCLGSGKTLDGFRPHHSEGAEFSDLNEEIRPGRKGEGKRSCDTIGLQAAFLHLSNKIHRSRECESNLFDGAGCVLMKVV